MDLSEINLNQLIKASIDAGEAIMKVYETDFDVEHKSDASPLTLADTNSHNVIVSALKKHYHHIPILSEEGQDIPYEERKDWEMFWLVDPLDGTKEFVKRNGEFTVNIALIHNQKPVIGVIYAPVLDTLYIGQVGLGAYKIENCKAVWNNQMPITQIGEQLPNQTTDIFTVVASRSHMSEETATFIREAEAKHGEVVNLSAGSSIKLCLVAEGKADAYPRFAPTMEWDTAAGQAIVEAVGGTVTIAEGEEKETKPLLYNKENLRNPWFLVVGKLHKISEKG